MMIGDGKGRGHHRADEFGLSSAMSTDEIAKSIRSLKIVDRVANYLILIRPSERLQAVSEAYMGDGNYISSGNIRTRWYDGALKSVPRIRW